MLVKKNQKYLKKKKSIKETLWGNPNKGISGVKDADPNELTLENAPWKMVKEDKDGAGRILYTAGEALRLGAVLLSPIMPNRTKTLLDALNVKENNFSWGTLKAGTRIKSHEPLFPRIK